MNIQQIKAPALCFMAGYIFQYVDHFHKSILNHGYTLALMALTVCVVITLLNRKQVINIGRTEAIAPNVQAVEMRMIEAQPQQQQTIKLAQKQAAR